VGECKCEVGGVATKEGGARGELGGEEGMRGRRRGRAREEGSGRREIDCAGERPRGRRARGGRREAREVVGEIGTAGSLVWRAELGAWRVREVCVGRVWGVEAWREQGG
jgi:hypothetical protein